MTSGYYRFPTIQQDTIVFVADDDLWTVARQGGIARRLTSNLGEVNYPALSPDGEWLAFVGREEGMPEVYVMPAQGGSARRMTYLNNRCHVMGWSPDGRSVLFASTYGQFYQGSFGILRIDLATRNGAVTPVPVGPARSIAFGPQGQVVIGRSIGDPARWKRYRGGTAGNLWIDRSGDGQFERFLAGLTGNIAAPMWLETSAGPRIFFVSDHEGIGNLYNCQPDGSDLRRSTDHEDFYTRNPSTDGRRIVYHAGADLYVYDPVLGRSEAVAVDGRSPRVQRNRKFVSATAYLDHARLHPPGDALTVTTRGKAFAFYNHEGPVLQIGKRDGVRYRLPDWLNDGQRIVLLDDAAGEEELVIYSADPDEEPRRLAGLDIGRAVALRISPTEDQIALSNHRNELLIIDMATAALTVVDRSAWRPIAGFDWSPDGRWLAYGFATTISTTEIRLYHLPEPIIEGETGDSEAEKPHLQNPVAITQPVLHDVGPAFDPEGKYLYFLSYREFNPVNDALQFDLGFPWGMRPYLVTLRADLPNPFVPQPGEGGDEHEDESDDDDDDEEEEEEEDSEHDEAGEEELAGEEDEEEGDDEGDEGDEDDLAVRMRRRTTQFDATAAATHAAKASGKEHDKHGDGESHAANSKGKKPKPVVIELDGIERRVLAFPIPDGRYGQIAGTTGRAIFTSFPVKGMLDDDHDWDDDDEPEFGALRAWVFKEFKSETVADNVTAFELSRNRKKLVYMSGRRVRVISAAEKAPSDSGPARKSGWIDLSRVKVSVDPQSEWEQMYREAWRLQRDHFWTEDMAEVDWTVVFNRYFPLIERVGTRSEFSDLVWEMQGELGSSHAYEFGGDYRSSPQYSQGVLGATFVWDPAANGYVISGILAGDSWHAEASSPLAGPGVDVRTGDVLLAINGQRLDADTSPAHLLVNQAGNEVLLTLALRPEAPAAAGKPADKPASKPVGKPADKKGGHTHTAGRPADPEAKAPRSRAAIVRAIHHDAEARYRAWVDGNRRRVHMATAGRIGYLHIPDMGPRGYAEFHRGFLAEVARDGLIVDVRYNGGGHVSQLLLEKLARRRIGYDKSRWGGMMPYPNESVGGPIVALTNEHAGSDGDIFCHSFKLLKLGPLIGKRTWGGVIGISPHHPLVDGTVTTQPEYSFWFEDVGWTVENYGTDPDIEVDMTPQDYVAGRDAQLDQAVATALAMLADKPILKPDLATRPSRALPKLPRQT